MSKGLKAALSVTAILVPLVGAPTLALGIDSKTVDQLSHFVDCIGLLVSDPGEHTKLCLPSPSQVTQEQINDLLGPPSAGTAPPPSSSSSSSSSGPPV